MTTIVEQSAEHPEVWNLIPWYVTARLTESDSHRVEAHLRTCAACRAETAEQRQIHVIMAADVPLEQLPTAGLRRLQLRIAEQSSTTVPAHAQPRSAGRQPRWTSVMAASVAVMAVALSIVAGVLWSQNQQRGAADYYTLSTATPHAPNEVIRAVFASTITLSELQGVLDDAHLSIVSGPTEAGVYALANSGTQPTEWSLQRLRRQPMVRFAEATTTAASAAKSP